MTETNPGDPVNSGDAAPPRPSNSDSPPGADESVTSQSDPNGPTEEASKRAPRDTSKRTPEGTPGIHSEVGSESFRLIVESVRDYAIFMLDPHGYIATWNAGAERIKGYRASEIIGKHFSVFYTPDAVAKRHPQYELEVATREGKYEEEGWRVRKDGSRFWANVVITALRGRNGKLVGFAKVTRDMTERRRTEEDLREARDDLERRVQERTAELTRANQILQSEVGRRQSLEEMLLQQTEQLRSEAGRKDQFLAMLAHELRNPLGAVSNALHVLSMTMPDSQAFRRAREVALRQISHQTRLVDDLLDVSRITRGKIELRHEKLDLAKVVKDAAEDYRSSLESTGVNLRVHVPSEPIEVIGDPTRMAQVVGNLLDNARKFTPPAGQVTVRVDATGDEITISVRDSGIGIETDVIGQIFEPFSQADRSLDRSGGGLGLGLALVKGLVNLHGGSVEAHSAGAGQGTEFIVRLPQLPAHSFRKRDSGTSRRPTILIIEDTQDAAETLGDILEAFGYQVEIAMDGREGLQKALDHHPDVVLCDIGLPGMDGYTVAAELRDNAAMSETGLVAITGYGTEEDRRRSEAAGFQAHLIKPVNPDELRKILARMADEPNP